MSEHSSWKGKAPGEPVEGQTYRRDGWSYHETVGYLPIDAWNQLRLAVGMDQMRVLHCYDVENPRYGTLVQTSFIASPIGRAFLHEWGRMQETGYWT